MHSSLRALRLLLDDFVAGAPFWPFWNAFMEHLETFRPEELLSPESRVAYDELQELVYMAAPDPVPPAERADGIIGADELRRRIRAIRLVSADGQVV